MSTIEFTIPGEVATQGSMAVNRETGRVFHSNHKRSARSTKPTVTQWRKHARDFAAMAMRRHPIIDGPVSVRARFYLPRPKRPRCGVPDTKPDLDKLCRALGDALEGVVMVQDSRIVHWDALKLWANDGEPGVAVIVEPWTPR